MNDYCVPWWVHDAVRSYETLREQKMNTYTVTDSVGRDHTVRADRYEPATGPGGDACIINYHFFADGTRVASFLNPRAITTKPGDSPDIVRTRASFTVNGYPADVALRLKQWAAEHMWTISDLATVKL